MLNNLYPNLNKTNCGDQERSIPVCGPNRLQLGLYEEGEVGWAISLGKTHLRLQMLPRAAIKHVKHFKTFVGTQQSVKIMYSLVNGEEKMSWNV